MHLLFTRFPLESAYGGAENQTRWLMQGLRSRGHEVSFVGSCPILLEYCRADGISAVELDIGPPPVTQWNALSFLWRQCTMRKRLEGVLQSFQGIDAICMLSLSEKILLTEAAQARSIPTYWIEHDSVDRWLTINPYLAQIKRLSKYVTTIVVSELSSKIYQEIGWSEEQLVTIPNGVEVRKESQRDTKRMQESNHLRIGCIARLSEEKGVDLLIEALVSVPEGHLTVVGEGDQYESLCVLSEQLNIHDRITFAGRVDDIEQFYAEIDVLVLPSKHHDPFGLVIAEAMQRGVPTLLTDACGIAGYLRDGHDAIIVPAQNHAALSEGLQNILDDDVRSQLSVAGRKTAQEKFSIEGMVEGYERVFGK